MNRWPLLAASLALTGCGAQLHAAGAESATGALDALTAPNASAAIDELAAGAATSATEAARVVLESPATKRDLSDLARALRSEMLATRDALLDDTLRAEVAAIREEAAGAPLRADVDRLIDEVSPRLADAVAKAVSAGAAPLEASARRDAGYFKDVAIALAVAAVALLLALAFAIYELRRHRAELRALLSAHRP